MTEDEKMRKYRLVTTLLVTLTAVVWIAWDLVAYLSGGNESTISRVVTEASRDWPIIPLLVGIVLGHLFFSQHAPRSP